MLQNHSWSFYSPYPCNLIGSSSGDFDSTGVQWTKECTAGTENPGKQTPELLAASGPRLPVAQNIEENDEEMRVG